MERKVLLLLIIALTSVSAYGSESKKNIDNYEDEDYDYTYDDDSDEEGVEKSEKAISNEVNTIKVTQNEENTVNVPSSETTLRPATYEVTENVIDIPDNSTRRGPVIVNYTTPIPLNSANVVNTGNIKDKQVNLNGNNPNFNYGFVPPLNNVIRDPNNVPVNYKPNTPNNNYGFVDTGSEDAKIKKNSFSIFHVKAEYDDKPATPNNDRPSGFKEYILGLKRGIVNGFYKLFNKKQSQVEAQESVTDHREVYNKYEKSPPNRFGYAVRHDEDDEYD